MPFKVFDRVKQISTTSGTANFTFASTPTGYKAFSTVLSNTDTTFYCIVGSSGATLAAGEWEVGIGTWSGGNTLERTTIISNHENTLARLNFLSGNKDVFMTYPATRAIYNQTGVDAVINNNTVGRGAANRTNNIAFGPSALSNASTTGGANIAIGTDTLKNAISADRSVVIGAGAGLNITTAGTNIAIGNETMRGNISGVDITGSENIAIGAYSQDKLTSGIRNTAVGTVTMRGNSTLGVSGNRNSAFGYSSLSSLSTGNDNIVVGTFSGDSISSGYQNVILGNSSGTGITNGHDNIGIGHTSMGGNASNMIGIGSQTYYQNPTGSDCVAIGGSALFQLSSGIRNVAIGTVAGYGITAGAQNVAIGFYSMQNGNGLNCTGDGNTAIGPYSLNSMTTGGYNVGIATESGRYITSGTHNVAIGYQSAASLTTGTNNIHVGRNANTGAAAATNEIVIGTSVTGLGSNTTSIGNSSTTQAKIFGQVAVGGNTPASATATGVAGTITWDANYIYVCTATNTWKRVAIATW